MNTKVINLDINDKLYDTITAKQGDLKSRFLKFILTDSYSGRGALDLEGINVRAYASRPDGKVSYLDLEINDAAKGECTLELTNQMLAIAGKVKMELLLYKGDAKYSSIPFVLNVVGSVNNDKAIESSNEFGALTRALDKVNSIDGKFDDLGSQLDNKATQIELEVERKRINSFTSLPQQGVTTVGDAELVDGRTGADGKTYANIGGAVRGQVGTIRDVLEVKNNPNLLNTDKCVLDKFPSNGKDLNDSINWDSATGFLTTNIIDTSTDKTLIYQGAGSYQCYCMEAGDNGVVIRGTAIANEIPFTVGNDCKKAVLKITYNATWKDNFMVSYNTLPNEFIPYGEIENRLDRIEKEIKANNSTIIVPNDKCYFEKKATLLLCFDGWKKATFDLFAPYLKEKGIPFTVFSGFDTINQPNYWTSNDVRQGMNTHGMTLGMYTRQPSVTYSYIKNWDEQFNQMKVAVDGCKNLGFNRPLIASYSGGQHTATTEEILKKVYGFRLARTTDEGEIIVNRNLFNVNCSSLGGENWVIWGKKLIDSIISNGYVKSLMTHNIISDIDTDSTYNVTFEQFKEVVDYITEKVNLGQLQCLSYEDFYKQIILPKTADIGTHALVNEVDGNQHEYLFSNNGWVELTDYAQYK